MKDCPTDLELHEKVLVRTVVSPLGEFHYTYEAGRVERFTKTRVVIKAGGNELHFRRDNGNRVGGYQYTYIHKWDDAEAQAAFQKQEAARAAKDAKRDARLADLNALPAIKPSDIADFITRLDKKVRDAVAGLKGAMDGIERDFGWTRKSMEDPNRSSIHQPNGSVYQALHERATEVQVINDILRDLRIAIGKPITDIEKTMAKHAEDDE